MPRKQSTRTRGRAAVRDARARDATRPTRGSLRRQNTAVSSANSPTISTTTASALARAGERAEARQLLGQALGLAKERYVCRFIVAAAYVDLGDTEQALDSLEQAYLQRST